jgi:hypothetical protein
MLLGEKFYDWTIIDNSKLSKVKVECKCGEERVMRAWNIKSGQPRMCRACYNKEKIIDSLVAVGTKFNDWEIVSLDFQHKLSNTGGLKQHVRCKCGYETFLELSPLKAERTKSCRQCGEQKRRKNYRDIPSSYIRQILNGADKRRYSFEISIEEVWEIFENQNKKCALSGVDINFENKTASLDRIDSTKGYVKNNVQWVHKIINQMKSNRTDRVFIEWCKVVAEHKEK